MSFNPRERTCIAVPRCSLCRFDLEKGDLIVAGYDTNNASAEFTFEPPKWATATLNGVPIHMCCGPCGDPPRFMPCCHAACFRLARHSVTLELVPAAEYWFDLSPSQCRQRATRLRQAMVGHLRRAFPDTHIPDELWLKVAAPLVREYAVCLLLHAVSHVEMPRLEYLDWQHRRKPAVFLDRDIYATYMTFEGIRYIRELRNATEGEAQEGEQLVLAAESDRGVDRVYVAFDHHGVRVVQFASSHNPSPGSESVPGLWWTCLRQDGGIPFLKTISDGLKLRSLCHELSPDGWLPLQVGWPVPEPGQTAFLAEIDASSVLFDAHPWLRYGWDPSLDIPPRHRMARLDLNYPDITGYSVASLGLGVCMIHAHRKGGTDPEYDWYGKHIQQWIYMPINPGEYVTEIWLLTGRLLNSNKSIGLAFLTNRGNITSFASWTRAGQRFQALYRYQCVHKPQQHGSHIYHTAINLSTFFTQDCKNHFHFAFPTTNSQDSNSSTGNGTHQQPEPRERPPPLIPLSPPMEVEDSRHRYFSSCRLDGVVEMISCRSRPGGAHQHSDGEPVIIGMLVRYANGDRVCVGAFRFDWAEEPVRVELKGRVYIGCSRDPKFVREVRADLPPPGESGMEWMEVPLRGRLEWWFSRDKAEVHHFGEGEG